MRFMSEFTVGDYVTVGPNKESPLRSEREEPAWRGKITGVYNTKVDGGEIITSYNVEPPGERGAARNVLEPRLSR